MEGTYFDYIMHKIEQDNPMHAKKLKNSLAVFDENYRADFEIFFKKYEGMIAANGLAFDYAIESYLRFCSDMVFEQIAFIRTGKYSNTSFDEVNEKVYANPEVMEYHMHGLLVSQFLWAHHYNIFLFFKHNLERFAGTAKQVLEIGGGHGLYTNEILQQLRKTTITNIFLNMLMTHFYLHL